MKTMYLIVADVTTVYRSKLRRKMNRKTLCNLLIFCCCCWWCYAVGVKPGPCSPRCHCVHLRSTTSVRGSRLSAVDWHQVMIAYRLQQK